MTTPKDPVDIARALRDDYEATCRDAKIPSAGAMYWRASIRARAEAARKVDRPLTVAAGVAAAAVVGAGAAVIGTAWKMMPAEWSHWTPLNPLVANPVMTLALGAAALVAISPLALIALGAFGSRTRFDPPQD